LAGEENHKTTWSLFKLILTARNFMKCAANRWEWRWRSMKTKMNMEMEA